MCKTAIYFQLISTLLLFASSSAAAQIRNVELVNPDGSVPTNVKAVAILAPSVYLDEHLTALDPVDGGTQPTAIDQPPIVPLGEGGTLAIPVAAKTVIAQNEHGFAFVPPGTVTGKVKLRAWAKLKIDTAMVPQSVREKYQIHILWRNSFAGILPVDILAQGANQTADPFGGTSSADPFDDVPAAPSDWRFHAYVTRSQVVQLADQTISVPPGEVTILLNLPGAELATSPSAPTITLGIVRTISHQMVEFKFPQFGTAHGRLIEEAKLPDWASGGNTATRIVALPIGVSAMTATPSPSELLAGQRNSPKFRDDPFGNAVSDQQVMLADAYAHYFASAAGTTARTSIVGNAIIPTDENGRFTFDVLPVGQYKLLVFGLNSPNGSLSQSEVAQSLNRFGSGVGSNTFGEMTFMIEANAHVDLGDVSWQVNSAEPKVATIPNLHPRYEPGGLAKTVDSRSFSPPHPEETAAIANARIVAALDREVSQIDYNAMPLQQVFESLSDDQNIPILMNVFETDQLGVSTDAPVSLSLPPITLRSLLNHVLAQVDRELTFVVRDEVLLITSRDDAAEHPGATSGATTGFPALAPYSTSSMATYVTSETIERWLKSAPHDADRTELKQQLESQLSAEFDNAQQARRAEIDRLQALLEQSRNWLDQRQQQRDEIIKQKVQDLIDTLNPPPLSR